MTTIRGKERQGPAATNLEIDSRSVDDSSASDVAVKYDLDDCVKWIEARRLERVCLQFPDSLLSDAVPVALYLERRLGKKVYILGDTTCGSCCVDEIAAKHINADGIVHFGHACLNPTCHLEVFHILEKRNADVDSLIETISTYFDDATKKIILFYDAAYAHAVEEVQRLLRRKYPMLVVTELACRSNIDVMKTTSVPQSTISGRFWKLDNGYKIQDYEALYIGADDKTLASLALSIAAKSWHRVLDKEIARFEIVRNPWLKRRRYLVEKLRDARTVGIVVATLGIKDYLESLNAIKRILTEKNKKSYIFCVGKPNPAKLANFPEVDAFVVIACPENEIFDSKEYYKPLLTPFEVELAFNSLRDPSSHYCLDFRQILPGGKNYMEFQASTEADVSLITGELRNSEGANVSKDASSDALTKVDPGTVTIAKAGANFLNARTWRGVERRLAEDPVKPAEKGRSGLPTSYVDEPIHG